MKVRGIKHRKKKIMKKRKNLNQIRFNSENKEKRFSTIYDEKYSLIFHNNNIK